VILLVVMFFPLVFLGFGAYEFYQYQSGTPTTATIDHCGHSGGGPRCTGTWSLGGAPHSGSIKGNEEYPDGSSVDVRVHGGAAYTASAGNEGFLAGGLTLAMFAVLLALSMLWRRRTGR
jgi:hypothetical protein